MWKKTHNLTWSFLVGGISILSIVLIYQIAWGAGFISPNSLPGDATDVGIVLNPAVVDLDLNEKTIIDTALTATSTKAGVIDVRDDTASKAAIYGQTDNSSGYAIWGNAPAGGKAGYFQGELCLNGTAPADCITAWPAGGGGFWEEHFDGAATAHNDIRNTNTLGSVIIYSNGVDGFQRFMHNTADSSTGNPNTFLGYKAGIIPIPSGDNTGIGYGVMSANLFGGSFNTAVGHFALKNSKDGDSNTAVGAWAMQNNDWGRGNTAVGKSAGQAIISGEWNTFLGAEAGYSTIGLLGLNTGSDNTAVGALSLRANQRGEKNTAIGEQAGGVLTTVGNSDKNTFLGTQSGYQLTTGSNNVFLGYRAGYNEVNTSNKLYIANSETNPPLIYGDFSAGNVGINTITPAHNLHIAGQGVNNAELDIQSGSNNYWRLYHYNNTEELRFRNEDASPVNVLSLDNNGFVGLGMELAAPASRLDVVGLFTEGTAIRASGAGYGLSASGSYAGIYAAHDVSVGSKAGIFDGDVDIQNGNLNMNGDIKMGGPNYFLTNSLQAFGAPPGTACDAATEMGRMTFDYLNNRLYVCSGPNWATSWRFKQF